MSTTIHRQPTSPSGMTEVSPMLLGCADGVSQIEEGWLGDLPSDV